ncbi:MAG: YihY/virulence factor BrkB family protein [Gammaproteobacteria bacterium]|nr:YihY/virulence factor BrkB family protein [Gammaproteobacteria bacterium]
MNKEGWKRLRERLWEREAPTQRERILLAFGRYAFVLVRDLFAGQLSMRAMSLVYTTLLSLVPLLALGFSLFKALGVHNMLEPALLKFLEPLGPKAPEVTQNIIGFVENIKVGVLGSLGVGLLFYTAVSMIQKVESSFNFIWRIERARPLSQRVGEYLAVLIVGPVLVFSALGITASIFNSELVSRIAAMEPFGTTIYLIGRLIPYVLVIGAFTFVYGFIPNTRVKLNAAAAGGVLAGVLWQSASLLFASFVGGMNAYDAIYSGFAIVILLLIWFYIGWLILLVGCQLAYYVQHPEQLTPTRVAPFLSGRSAEALGLAIVALVGRRYIDGQAPPTEDEIARQLNGNPDHVGRVVDVLRHHGVLAHTDGDDKPRLLPARDLDALTLGELWLMIRRGFDPAGRPRGRDEVGRRVAALLEDAEGVFAGNHGSRSVRQWLVGGNG